jgi:hypothetical protein
VSYATEAAAIRSRFNTEWGATTSVAWPNVAFTPTTGTPWVRLTILPADAAQTTMGTNGGGVFEYTGLVNVQVFVPENEGDGEARTLAEQVCGIFRGVTAGGITYVGPTGEGPYTQTVGNDGAGWFQINVWVPYRRLSQ